MINKKLDIIQKELDTIKQLINDKKYIDSIDKGLEYTNNQLNKLQNRIDKAIEYINNGYLSTGEMVNILAQEELLNILKGDNK